MQTCVWKKYILYYNLQEHWGSGVPFVIIICRVKNDVSSNIKGGSGG